MKIYEPGEDSYLLQKYVEKYAKGIVLDMGTGSGIQGITAAKNAKRVICIDINPKAIKQAKLSAEVEKIKNMEFIKSDLFEKVKDKFEVIAFNPPYLPKEKHVNDVALVSGKRGYDVTVKFLNQVNNYLQNDGVILLISSSLASQPVIIKTIETNLLDYEILETVHVFFEDIILYKLSKSEKLKKFEKLGVKNSKVFAHGKRGVIVKGQYKNKTVSIKIKKKESEALGTIENEVRILKILNKHNIGPRLIKYDKDYMMYIFVKGIFIEEFFKSNSKNNIILMLKKIFNQLHKMDKLGINKFEMHHPFKHILIDKEPVLIDFERGRHTNDPKNVTQFCDFLTSEHVKEIFIKKKLTIDIKEMITLAKKYKKNHDIKLIYNYLENVAS